MVKGLPGISRRFDYHAYIPGPHDAQLLTSDLVRGERDGHAFVERASRFCQSSRERGRNVERPVVVLLGRVTGAFKRRVEPVTPGLVPVDQSDSNSGLETHPERGTPVVRCNVPRAHYRLPTIIVPGPSMLSAKPNTPTVTSLNPAVLKARSPLCNPDSKASMHA